MTWCCWVLEYVPCPNQLRNIGGNDFWAGSPPSARTMLGLKYTKSPRNKHSQASYSHWHTSGRFELHGTMHVNCLGTYYHNIINYSPKYITEDSTYNKSRATSSITRFAAYLGRNVSKIASRGSFSCHRHTSGRSDMHAKYLFGILYGSKYITEDSTLG